MIQINRNLLSQLVFQHEEAALDSNQALDSRRGKTFGLTFSTSNIEPMTGADLLMAYPRR